MDNVDFYRMSADEAIKALNARKEGLSENEAAERLKKYGFNEIVERRRRSDVELFIDQFKSFLVIILIVASAISIFLGELFDSIVILAIVFLNAAIGFLQTKKAEEAIRELKKISLPYVNVIRDKQIRTISTKELVPGDIIVLNVGDIVPADCRIISQVNLKVDESLLTGESIPVVKSEMKIDRHVPIYERTNMLFKGTSIVYGRCKALVTATGMATEFGKIAEKIQEPEEETPLQRKLEDFGKRLGTVFVIVCIAIFLIGTLSGKEIHQMLLAALSLAVAAVPEGLPAAITIALAFGVIKMAKRKSIVKRLSAVEGLGSVDVICVDKTGTLTMNEMTVRKIWTPEGEYHVTGEGYSMKGKFLRDNKVVDLKKTKDLKFLLTASLACNDAIVGKEFIGDPTEIALAVLAKKGGISNNFVRVAEIPFDSQRKMMSVACRMKGGKKYIFTKGAVDEVIKKCKYVLKGNKKVPLRDKRKILEKNIEYAREAYRVIALAMAEMNGEGISEENLIFLGLVALFDPPRPEVKQAIERCKAAGIRVIMITGDHRETALAIAKEIGIVGKVITGEELEKMPKDKFEKEVEEIGIYARTTPQQKLKIIEGLRAKGHIIAMTGDGINDVPALKKADIGVAMGQTGTEVAKEAGDIVISDDNFATIVDAVAHGRGIYSNIRKCIAYLLSGNFAEIAIIFIAVALGFPLPITAIQILWINLVTDGLPVLALAITPVDEKEEMSKRPRKKEQSLMAGMEYYIIHLPILLTAFALLLFYISLPEGLKKAQTAVFTTIVVSELYISLSCLSLDEPVKQISKNKFLIVAILSSLVLQFLIIYNPLLNEIFDTSPLKVDELAFIFFFSLLVFIFSEIYKMLKYKK